MSTERNCVIGKRSNFERNPRDFYRTPIEAVFPLRPYIQHINEYREPCAGDGALIKHLREIGLDCIQASDIQPMASEIDTLDALNLTYRNVPIITNPPWDRKILHPMIEHFITVAPLTWLLFDADWMHTRQSVPYMRYCHDVVSVGRVKWIEGSKMTGKDNCCWYAFRSDYNGGSARFWGRV